MRVTAGPTRGLRVDVARWCRGLVAIAVIVLGCLFASHPAFSQTRPRLVVYLHTSIRARALEEVLSRQLGSVDVVVCSRYRDFEREIAQPFDAALATQAVLQSHALPVGIRGTRSGEDKERFVLLSIGEPIARNRYQELTVGAVDILGRAKTAAFVAHLLGLKEPPEIKYVIKSEDLLPLLQFGTARAVLVSEREAAHIKTLSKLDLRTSVLEERVGLAAVSFHSDAGLRTIGPAIRALDLDTRRKLGIEAWQ